MSYQRSEPFKINAFHCRPRVDDSYAENTWRVLQAAIREINKRHTSNLSYEELYRFAYNMVLHKHGGYLYRGLGSLLKEHLRQVAEHVRAAPDAAFLAEVRTQWAWFELSLGHVRDVLMYMDRAYVRPRKKKSVHGLGVSLFRDVVVCDPLIMPRLVNALLSWIDAERRGEEIDGALVRAITRMLAELGEDDDGRSVYVSIFETEFLECTRRFYAREAQLYLAETTCSDYLRKAASRIREEKVRVESYLEPQTEAKVCRATEEELITKYMRELVDMNGSGLVWMLRNDKVYDLRLMHTLFRNVPEGDEVLRNNLRNEVLQRGIAIVRESQDANDPNSLIVSILSLKEKYDRILNISFCIPTSIYNAEILDLTGGGSASLSVEAQASSLRRAGSSSSAPPLSLSFDMSSSFAMSASAGSKSAKPIPDKKYVNTVNEAFERFLNGFPEGAEYISMYVDKLIRKDFKGSTDDEIETKLDAVMTMFRYLHDKDVFEKYCKIHLSRRLLESRSSNTDADRSFISKIKNECGYLYTSKMEVMFKDMKISDECSQQFHNHVATNNLPMGGIDLNVSVLTTLSWPIHAKQPCIVPEVVLRATAQFEKYYLSKHNGRVLTWQRAMGSAELLGRFENGSRVVDVVTSAQAMCVLMLYNDRDSMKFSEIREATKMEEAELKRIMQSLSLAKYRLLTKSPACREVNADDIFSFNERFTSKTRRIRLQIIAAPREIVQTQMKTKIYDDRKPLIEAAIVRVMKTHRVMEHQKLVMEVTSQLVGRFHPNPQDIKRRIESLVDREFLERKVEQRQTYHYIA